MDSKGMLMGGINWAGTYVNNDFHLPWILLPDLGLTAVGCRPSDNTHQQYDNYGIHTT